jgi:small-conductance mechanosensitive channel
MESTSFLEILKAFIIPCLVFGGSIVLASLLGKARWFAVWIKRPFQFFVFSVTVWLFFWLLDLPEYELYAVALVVATALGGIVHIVISFIFTNFFSRKRDIHLPPLLRNVILAVTYLSILLLALKIAVPGFSLSPLVLASGVLSLVVGLALQDVLSNLIAGITLSVERPLRKDDWVLIEGQEGKVVEITWRTTKILTRQNDYVIYPNRLVAERQLRNFIYPTRLHRLTVSIGLPYSALPSIAEEALLEVPGKVHGILKRPAPHVLLQSFDDFSIAYELRVWIDDYDNYEIIESDIRKEIFYSLKRYGVVIPFPIRTVHLHKGKAPSEEWKEEHYYRLCVLSGPLKGEVFPLEDKAVKIGRGVECDLDLRDPVTSKEHAKIGYKEGDYTVQDSDSTHGTFVNGVKIKKRKLRSGDEISIGNSILRFEQIDFS